MNDERHTLSRRHFLAASGLTLMTPPSASADAREPPPDVGRKFHSDGTVRPFAGNTIIAHLPQQGSGFVLFDHLLNIYRRLPAHGFSRKLALLPTSSYHMTLFGGANDQQRERGPWPATIDRDMPIADCNALLAESLSGFRTECPPPFRMTVDLSRPPDALSPITVPLRPADAGETDKLRRLRDRLAERLQIRGADHDDYRYHITIAYQIDWFDALETQDYQSSMVDWLALLASSDPVITLGAPEFCVFEDMFAFRSLFTLAS